MTVDTKIRPDNQSRIHPKDECGYVICDMGEKGNTMDPTVIREATNAFFDFHLSNKKMVRRIVVGPKVKLIEEDDNRH